jgi:glycosyltransferase involved in cell wall biosynthesis
MRVSVLLPCRNAAAHLDRAAASLSRQTLTDIEIIAVDDGSTDETPAKLHDWAAHDDRVRVILAGRRGLVGALNVAAAAASADLLARMDADDIAHPERLRLQVELMDAVPGLAATGTRVRYFPRRLVRDGARRYERWLNHVVEPARIARDIFVECPIPHPTLMIRRSAFDAAGGYRDEGWPEDYDLILRLWRAGLRLGKVPRVLLAWRERADRTSRVDGRYSREAFLACRLAHLLPTLVGDRRLVVAGAGPTGKAFARAALERGARIAAFVEVDPRKIGQEIHGAPVVAPTEITALKGCFGVAAVAGESARAEIRRRFRAAGWREMADFCAVA